MAGDCTRTEFEQQAEVALLTYRFLRWLLILLPANLLIVTTVVAALSRDLPGSISAFYLGPVRDVFVGTLIALAACLIAYQGVGELEDYNLNGAGLYVVFVALIPTGFPEMMDALRRNSLPGAVTPAEYVTFLRVALTALLGLCLLLMALEIRSGRIAQLLRASRLVLAFVVATGAVLAWFLALAMAQVWVGPADQVTMPGVTIGPLQLSVHNLAAVFLIGALAVSVLTNTWPFYRFADLASTGQLAYLWIFLGITAGAALVALVVHAVSPRHVVIAVEWWEIGLFGIFWATETWRIARRRDGAWSGEAAQGPLWDPPRMPLPQA